MVKTKKQRPLKTLSGFKSRIPLANKSNISSNKLVWERSPDTLWDRKDSSKGPPSSHGSIYDAAWVSDQSDTTKSPYRSPGSAPKEVSRSITPSPPRPTPIDPNSESPLSQLETFETPFLYGHGTELAPIAEQRSIATLRTDCGGGGGRTSSLSTSEISSLLKHQPSGTNSDRSRSDAPFHHPLRRQESFSLDGLAPSNITTVARAGTSENNDNGHKHSCSRSKRGESSEPAGPNSGNGLDYDNGISSGSSNSGGAGVLHLRNTIKRHSPPIVEIVDIHAYPQRPTHPPHRTPAPPAGFPKWMLSYAGENESSASSSPRHRSRPVGEQSFRGARSAYANLESRPFMRLRRRRRFGSLLPEEQGADSTPGVSYGAALRAEIMPSDSLATPTSQEQEAWPLLKCKACGRPNNQRWSILSTVTGRGTGVRRGKDWCTRCLWRKVRACIHCCCAYSGVECIRGEYMI